MIGLTLWGCAGKMTRVTRALQRYETNLRVQATPVATDVTIGQVSSFSLVLTNVSATERVDGCVGEARDWVLLAVPPEARQGRQPAAGESRTVPDPFCGRRFNLQPGQALSWREDWTVPDVGVGEAKLLLSVQVVDPVDCGYACYATMLTTAVSGLQLRRDR